MSPLGLAVAGPLPAKISAASVLETWGQTDCRPHAPGQGSSLQPKRQAT
eukprot:CAMPEP_0168425530 /NCGR_PEP_ID=MMETSP0228-20121227/35371_1 /TAXON_ID=133427 /ORGANISM="Protoceratium reticulatum, Strain CCCM 535 (=CCMP 1889)" /LENGTH=48 /DNA_ID= /DNA_START= /DNA_END= /DNA_ORIENTATION=